MTHILSALIPVFSLIVIGYFFKRIKFPSYEFWPLADKLTYHVLMPSLLIYKLSSASLKQENSFEFVLSAIITISLVLFALMLINKFYKVEGSSFSSIVQGGVRFNTYVFLALADSIYGDEGLVLAAIILTFIIPFINVICISVFALYVNENKLSLKYLLKSIFTNPLIIACFIGGSINFISLDLPIVVNKILAILSSAALPLGLLSVGFGLIIRDMNSLKFEITISTFAKLILTPLIMYFMAQTFSLNSQMTAILVIFAVLPTAPSSFVLARQLGGDITLMSSVITVQTLLSAFFIIYALKYIV
ncbi:MAG: AEC family transporter [Campylobacteraceae bacterium]|nr:AEC family transporter [Campylobacteraceae bacterium]